MLTERVIILISQGGQRQFFKIDRKLNTSLKLELIYCMNS